MRVALNALSAKQGGGISVLTNLLPYLAQIDNKNSYVIFYSSRQREFVHTIPESFQKVAINYLPANPFVRVLWEQFIFPVYLLWYRIDLLYSVGNTTSLLAPCKIVLLIENANPYSLLDIKYSRQERFRNILLFWLGWLSARRADKIRFVSENSMRLMVKQLNVPLQKCVVMPHGVAIAEAPHPIYDLPSPRGRGEGEGRPYILTIGANGPHRNIARLLKAFSMLVNQHNYKGNLLVVGNTGSTAYKKALENLVQELRLENRVVFTGEVSHSKVADYYAGAEAFVFASLEETFGIPLIEAMAIGVPIAASDCDLDAAHRGKCFNPFREICGNAARYFNPFDIEEMVRALQRVIADEALRRELIANGKERVKQYDLDTTARALAHLFEVCYNPTL